MTHHELRRRIGLAWNALRHGQPATPPQLTLQRFDAPKVMISGIGVTLRIHPCVTITEEQQ